MKKLFTYLFLTSLLINFYFLYLKPKIDSNVKIQTFLKLFDNDNIKPVDASLISNDTSIVVLSPVQNINITSPFGNRVHPITKKIEFHNGVDLSGTLNENIYASDIGYVKDVYYDEIGGKQIVIRYENYICGYAHLNDVLVKVGDIVKQNEVIGKMGNTGRSTGTHLHLTLRTVKNEYLNPENFLKSKNLENSTFITQK